jgi:hypothetical protein
MPFFSIFDCFIAPIPAASFCEQDEACCTNGDVSGTNAACEAVDVSFGTSEVETERGDAEFVLQDFPGFQIPLNATISASGLSQPQPPLMREPAMVRQTTVHQVAWQWGLSEAEASELVNNVERAQSPAR